VLDDKGVLRRGPRGARVWVAIYPLKPARAQASGATFPTHWGLKGSRLWCITRVVEIDAAAAGCKVFTKLGVTSRAELTTVDLQIQ
jgi:hypothetical protein